MQHAPLGTAPHEHGFEAAHPFLHLIAQAAWEKASCFTLSQRSISSAISTQSLEHFMSDRQ